MVVSRMLVRRCSKRSRALDDLVEEVWLAEHQNAAFARDVEDLIEECLQLGSLAVRAWGDLVDDLLSGAELDFDLVDATFGETVSRMGRSFERVLQLAARAHGCGCVVKGTDALTSALEEVRGIKEEYDRVWPTNGDPFALSRQPQPCNTEPGPEPVIANTQ